MKNIILIDDDVETIQLIKLHFTPYNFSLFTFNTGLAAINSVNTLSSDLIIMDLELLDMDGIEVCRIIRDKKIISPILILSHQVEEKSKIQALESGADDYVTKPFSINELLARIKALLRRAEQTEIKPRIENVIHVNNLSIYIDKRCVFLNGKRLELTAKEYDLLFLLANSAGKTFKRKEILELVWGYAYGGYEYTLSSHINRLRAKIEVDLNNPEYILTTWGMGYRFAK